MGLKIEINKKSELILQYHHSRNRSWNVPTGTYVSTRIDMNISWLSCYYWWKWYRRLTVIIVHNTNTFISITFIFSSFYFHLLYIIVNYSFILISQVFISVPFIYTICDTLHDPTAARWCKERVDDVTLPYLTLLSPPSTLYSTPNSWVDDITLLSLLSIQQQQNAVKNPAMSWW